MRKLYIFDFDGTLANTFHQSALAYNQALKQHKQPIKHENIEEINFEEFIENMTHDEEILQTYADIYQNQNMKNTKAYPEIHETLKKLQNQENTTLTICSNRQQQQLEALTKQIFPDINFTQIIGYQENQPYKPNPQMIQKILDKYPQYDKNEIIYIGDRNTDIQTAKNAQLDLALVTWGQGNTEAYQDEYPIKIVEKPEQLLEL